MTIGVLIEGPKVSTNKSGNNSGGDKKGGGGVREWVKKNNSKLYHGYQVN